MAETITWNDFEKVELRIGTVVRAEEFPEARRPAYKLWIDFGEHGHKKTSAQITAKYSAQELVGRQVIAVTNFAPKQIANFMSECLVTGFANEQGEIVLATSDQPLPNGQRLV